MLILTRRLNESIIIGDNIKVRIAMIGGAIVNLAIEAPPDVSIHREEIYNKVGAKRLHSRQDDQNITPEMEKEIAQLIGENHHEPT